MLGPFPFRTVLAWECKTWSWLLCPLKMTLMTFLLPQAHILTDRGRDGGQMAPQNTFSEMLGSKEMILKSHKPEECSLLCLPISTLKALIRPAVENLVQLCF